MVNSDSEANGPTADEAKGAWQLPLNPHRQPKRREPEDQPSTARGLKIRISLGPKLTIKKDVVMPVQSPAATSIAKMEGGATASETILDRWQPCQADAEDAAREDGCAGDSSCTDTDDDGELIQRVSLCTRRWFLQAHFKEHLWSPCSPKVMGLAWVGLEDISFAGCHTNATV